MSEHCNDPIQGNCDDVLHDLYGFLDGELTDDRKDLIRHHLEDCSPCLEAFDFENELKALVARKCHDEVPDGLRERIAQAIVDCHDADTATTPTTNPTTSP